MADPNACPSCGALNPAAAAACSQCNYPLRAPFGVTQGSPAATTVPPPPPPAPAPEPAPVEAVSPQPKPAAAPEPAGPPVSGFDPGPRPVPRRRERPGAMQPIQMQLWLFAGAAIVIGIVYFAAQGFRHTNTIPVAGAQPDQQQRADLARAALERDSTNVAARIDLANLLYDTGNWSEAIIHYRSADRLDPKRSTTIVDLGVCYYNLSDFAAAESLFQHALTIDPHQVFALFNLGIVAESQRRWDDASDYFHRAMQSGPPDGMKEPLQQHLQAVMEKAGKKAPPLTP